MIFIDSIQLKRILDFPSLVSSIETAFSQQVQMPDRGRYAVNVPEYDDATLLIMPAWIPGAYLGIKTATIFPSNSRKGLPSVTATYLLLEGRTGRQLAMIQGTTLTQLRTAATSALASRYLSRPDSRSLLMVGAGALAAPLIGAHKSVRPIDRVSIWNRSTDRAERLSKLLLESGIQSTIAADLESAAGQADIISCATLSTEPLLHGSWISPGTHVDLVGAFTSEMRESDHSLIAMSDVFVDTYEGAADEAGDLIQAAAERSWDHSHIVSDLRELITGSHPGRTDIGATTVFKSVGCAIEDLAAAILAYERMTT